MASFPMLSDDSVLNSPRDDDNDLARLRPQGAWVTMHHQRLARACVTPDLCGSHYSNLFRRCECESSRQDSADHHHATG